ncbi:hypothetical protein [Rhizobium populisoli]|uniref:hypothetical protein n=1 Tax=Rhizobium populisoli TaxID=2859785 RepID=UPI001FE977FA|nr:hypothetical protein [Rhizobium populisoli]
MNIRTATEDDVASMSAMLEKLVAAGRRTMPTDEDYVRDHYVANPLVIRCSLAEDEDGSLLGFQSLIRAVKGNPYDTPVGWGIINPCVAGSSSNRRRHQTVRI